MWGSRLWRPRNILASIADVYQSRVRDSVFRPEKLHEAVENPLPLFRQL